MDKRWLVWFVFWLMYSNAAPGQCRLSESHQNVPCFGESTGSINLTVSGGVSPISFAWSNGAVTEDINGIPAGNYSVQVSDANGCNAGLQVLITQQSVLLPGSINTSLSRFCLGGTKPIGGTNAPYGPATGGSGTYTYSWQIQNGCAGGWTDIPGTNTTSYTPVAPSQTTCYRRKVTDNTCHSDALTEVKTFEIYPDLVSQDIVPSPSSSAVCSGNPVSALFTGGSGGFPGAYNDIYQFSLNGGVNWNQYTPGQEMSTTGLSGNKMVQVRTRRMPSGVDACNYGQFITVMWNVNPSPLPNSIIND